VNTHDFCPCWCFSADATVEVLDKGPVAMKYLNIGDKVLNGSSKTYEAVYAFAHLDFTAEADFLKISTSVIYQDSPFEITSEHMVFVKDGKDGKSRAVRAGSLQVGDILDGGVSGAITIAKIESTSRKDGLFAPLTASGTILVNGVVASNYISLQPAGNEYPVLANDLALPISQHTGIHIGMTPFRMLCMGVSSSFCDGYMIDGKPFWVDWGIKLATFADHQSLLVQLFILGAVFSLTLPLYGIEAVLGAKLAPLLCLVGAVLYCVNKKNALVAIRMEKKKAL